MSYDTAYYRWRGLGPYFAMFPLKFVDRVVLTFTKPGQRILDPFAGRASSIFSGAAHGRPSLGIEINPVGWIYGKTKLSPASADELNNRVSEIAEIANQLPDNMRENSVSFFRLCFSRDSLRFLIAARDNLNWKFNKIDRTLMALILVDLHGVRARSFSNQMRQSKAMSPAYCVRWWRENKLRPPQINPRGFLEKKIKWRYQKGIPTIVNSSVWLGDCSLLMPRVQAEIIRKDQKRFKLLFTSPPYMDISDYHRDQWLRLWMLGGEPTITRTGEKYKGPFASQRVYKGLLTNVFGQCAEVMSTSGYVYVRTDARQETFQITREALQSAFPHWHEKIVPRPYSKGTQTALYGDTERKPGEKDIVLTGPRA